MRRLPVILSILALLVASASAVTAAPRNVTNPMQADLDGGNYAITNTNQVTSDVLEAKVLVAVGNFAPLGAHGTIQLHAGDGDGVTLYVGKDDPTVTPPNAGLYIRRIDATHVELWVNTVGGFVRVA